MTALPIGLSPAEAIEYFRRKGYEISFAWQDLMHAAHAEAFTVAKMMRVDLLMTVNAAVDRAIANGETNEEFQRELTPVLQKEGWWGAAPVVDSRDGEAKIAQLGNPRRLDVIYDTNLRTSYASGRWEQITRLKATRPYLRYIHHASAHPRQGHAAWNNLVLPVDHVFWQTHYPPNGWFCHCTVQQLSDRDLERYGVSVSGDPKIDLVSYRNPRTGQVIEVPAGIDPGFGYNVGTANLGVQQTMLEQRIAAAPASLQEALRR